MKAYGGVKERQQVALRNLEKQLESGIKKVTEANWAGVKQVVSKPLTSSEISRINNEISILKSKI